MCNLHNVKNVTNIDIVDPLFSKLLFKLEIFICTEVK